MPWYVAVGLSVCLLLVLAAPLADRRVEERLEWFVLCVGAAALTISWSWSEAALVEAILRPLKVCAALLAGALFFSFSHEAVRRGVRRAMDKIGPKLAVGAAITALGLCAGALTMAVAVFALVELLYCMRLERSSEVHVAVLGCFAIGLGGALSSIGSPAGAIAMAKLSGAAYPVGPWFLLGLVGPWAIPAIAALGIAAGTLYARPSADRESPLAEDPLSLWSILVMTGKLYVFIAGLVLLGAGLAPLIDRLLLTAPPWSLFWLNSLSAVLDNASLAAVEISPSMTQNQLRYVMLGIAIAGGAVVTGNGPNLVAAHKLKVPLRDWAKIGLPTAALMMSFYFLSLALYAGLDR